MNFKIEEESTECPKHSKIYVGVDEFGNLVCNQCIFYLDSSCNITFLSKAVHDIKSKFDNVNEIYNQNKSQIIECSPNKIQMKIYEDLDGFFTLLTK